MIAPSNRRRSWHVVRWRSGNANRRAAPAAAVKKKLAFLPTNCRRGRRGVGGQLVLLHQSTCSRYNDGSHTICYVRSRQTGSVTVDGVFGYEGGFQQRTRACQSSRTSRISSTMAIGKRSPAYSRYWCWTDRHLLSTAQAGVVETLSDVNKAF